MERFCRFIVMIMEMCRGIWQINSQVRTINDNFADSSIIFIGFWIPKGEVWVVLSEAWRNLSPDGVNLTSKMKRVEKWGHIRSHGGCGNEVEVFSTSICSYMEWPTWESTQENIWGGSHKISILHTPNHSNLTCSSSSSPVATSMLVARTHANLARSSCSRNVTRQQRNEVLLEVSLLPPNPHEIYRSISFIVPWIELLLQSQRHQV